MTDQTGNDSVAAGRWATWLFVVGLLGPFVIALTIMALQAFGATFTRGVEPGLVGVWFCFLSEILAFVFGLVGRKTILGKVGLLGSSAVLAVFVILAFLWWSWSVSP